MWPFSNKEALGELVERLENLERGLKNIQLEWDDFYEKARRQVWRINKRADALDKRELESTEPAAEPTPESNELPAIGFLTPRQKQLQQSILQRRGPRRVTE